MATPRIYIETSVISYLTSRPSRDLIIAARQEMTSEWWEWRGTRFHPLISSLVLEEVSAGDRLAALRRIEICRPLEQLVVDDECQHLASRLLADKAIPADEEEDAVHIALATVSRMDFIATWNFAHMVSPAAKYRLQKHIDHLGYACPILATPEELLETLP